MKIELCANRDWWRTFGGFGSDASDHRINYYLHRLTNALLGTGNSVGWDFGAMYTDNPGEQVPFGGWNEATGFARKDGPIATFNKVTKKQWRAVMAIVDKVELVQYRCLYCGASSSDATAHGSCLGPKKE